MRLNHVRRTLPAFLATLLLLAALFFSGCLPIGPLGLLPGGRLRGVEHQGPEPDWSDLAEWRTVELQVDPGSPHSVNVGLLVHAGRPFVPATLRPAEKRWPRAIAEDARVVLRIQGTLFPRTARRVSDAVLTAALLEAGQLKYDPSYFEPDRTWFFELLPRK